MPAPAALTRTQHWREKYAVRISRTRGERTRAVIGLAARPGLDGAPR